VLALLGVAEDERFATFTGRAAHREELEAVMREWCAARSQADVIAAFERAEAAVGPVLDMADISNDPHYRARGVVVPVDGVPMQGLVARLSATPGRLGWAGRGLDADGEAIRRDGWSAFDDQAPTSR
jgi:crotonobetainyl-CoA:carnitine CoA-transferase CaiB-like acyl-CoA transferase